MTHRRILIERMARPSCNWPEEGGSALIAVLWLSAALAVIALALAAQVRNEIERAGAYSESVRAYYMATGSLERARLWMLWGPNYRLPDGSPRYYMPPASRMAMTYPDGLAVVEVIPESAKMSLNFARPEELERLMLALGAPLPQAQLLAEAIVDWRSGGTGSQFDAVYRTSSFLAPHASFKQLEELLLVRGMTTELFYGHFGPSATGEMIYYPGLRDCVSVYSSGQLNFDANSVPGPVLVALGWPWAAVHALEGRRAMRPFANMNDLTAFLPQELLGRLGFGGGNLVTLRSTATLRSATGLPAGIKRTVSELVRIRVADGTADPRPWVVLRWYDNETSPVLPQAYAVAGGSGEAGAAGGSVTTASPAGQQETKDEPVKVYTTQSPAASPGGASNTAAKPAAAPNKTATHEPVTVYHISGSGEVENAPAGPKQP